MKRDFLKYIAIADAYGAGFEFADEEFIKNNNNVEKYFNHYIEDESSGRYSDDTHMALAIASCFIQNRFESEDFAKELYESFKEDPRITFNPGYYFFVDSCNSFKDFTNGIKNNSDRCGAAVRSGVLGFYWNYLFVLEFAEKQAKITHNTDGGISSSQAVALAVHHSWNDMNIDLIEYLDEKIPGYNWGSGHTGKCSTNGIECVKTALMCLRRNNNFIDLLKDCCSLGGDADSICVIAASIASQMKSYDMSIKEFMWRDIEDGAFGKRLLEFLDGKIDKVLA